MDLAPRDSCGTN